MKVLPSEVVADLSLERACIDSIRQLQQVRVHPSKLNTAKIAAFLTHAQLLAAKLIESRCKNRTCFHSKTAEHLSGMLCNFKMSIAICST